MAVERGASKRIEAPASGSGPERDGPQRRPSDDGWPTPSGTPWSRGLWGRFLPERRRNGDPVPGGQSDRRNKKDGE